MKNEQLQSVAENCVIQNVNIQAKLEKNHNLFQSAKPTPSEMNITERQLQILLRFCNNDNNNNNNNNFSCSGKST